jgi:hypothetical protein
MESDKIVHCCDGAQPRRAGIVTLLLVISAAVLASCGSGLPHTNQVVATVTPAQATVPVTGTVQLVGSAMGFTDGNAVVVDWWVQEAKDTGDDPCGYLEPPPTSPCQFGYVIFGTVSKFPSSATYYAPQTPGTYHVTFEATQFEEFDHLTKTAEATITVTP